MVYRRIYIHESHEDAHFLKRFDCSSLPHERHKRFHQGGVLHGYIAFSRVSLLGASFVNVRQGSSTVITVLEDRVDLNMTRFGCVCVPVVCLSWGRMLMFPGQDLICKHFFS